MKERILKYKKSQTDNEKEKSKPIEKKVEPKIINLQAKNQDSEEDSEEEEKLVKPIKNLSETEEQIKTFCITANDIRTVLNKVADYEEEELSDSE